MKKLTIAALLAGQLLGSALPAFAQNAAPLRDTEVGTFSGVRLRIPFGGAAREPVRAGFAFSPTTRTAFQDGTVRTRIGEGVEFGIVGREPLQFSLAGTPVNRLAHGRAGPDGRRMGVSTLGWVGIGAGTVVVLVGGFYVWLMEESKCGPGEC